MSMWFSRRVDGEGFSRITRRLSLFLNISYINGICHWFATGYATDMPLECHWNATVHWNKPLSLTGSPDGHCSISSISATMASHWHCSSKPDPPPVANFVINCIPVNCSDEHCTGGQDTELSQRLLPSKPGTASRYASSFLTWATQFQSHYLHVLLDVSPILVFIVPSIMSNICPSEQL